MTTRIGRFVLLFALFGLVLTGCNTTPNFHAITGVVTEAGTAAGEASGAPLQGVTVALGSETVTTSRSGAFEFTNVPAGAVSLSFTLDGYASKTEDINLTADKQLSVELAPSGGRLTATGATQTSLDSLNGIETDETKVTIQGNISDLTGPDVAGSGVMGTAIRPLTTAITVDQLQALVNGRVTVIDFGLDGSFRQDLPVDPGNNTIQLRVFADNGNAYTSEPINVIVTLEQLDMRVILNWDQGGGTDVDLHMFQRNPGEANPAGGAASTSGPWWARDRHVYYANKRPSDFGTGFENPFLDIDDTGGFGPETIVLQEATSGYYHVWLHLYDLPSNVEETTAIVEVELNRPDSDTSIIETFEKTLTEDWEYWYVTTVDWNSGTFIEVPPVN